MAKNHDTAKEIWLAYYKKGTGKISITYEEALDLRPDLKERWDRFPPSQKKMLAWWLESAKRPETRLRRLTAGLAMIEAGRRFGIESVFKPPDPDKTSRPRESVRKVLGVSH